MKRMACIMGLMVAGVEAHARWKCPTPRDMGAKSHDNTGNKMGPCGPLSGAANWGKSGVTTLAPGPVTLVWEESISHAGAPFRIAVLDENGTSLAVLLDHVPHWDSSKPTYRNETTYTPYHMTVDIPDLACAKCSLQLLNIMTDKTTLCNITTCTYYADDNDCSGHVEAGKGKCLGAASVEPCKRADACFSNYHSCADVTITGTVAAKDARVEQPADWPYKGLAGYTREPAKWENGWLAGLAPKFVTRTGLCGASLPVQLGTTTGTAATAPASLRGNNSKPGVPSD